MFIEESHQNRVDHNWQGRALIVYKSVVWGPRSAVAKSVRAMMREWKTETAE
jgi:hypothetical protein